MRKVSFLTCEINPNKKIKVNFSGCNWNCKGCFAIAKNEIGRELSVNALVDLIIKSSNLIYGKLIEDIQATGGEPALNSNYLLSFIKQLRKIGVRKIGISTNGHLLDEKLISELSNLHVDYIKIDLKAYSDEIHKWYTGFSNENVLKAVRLLHKHNLNFYVRTIFIPDIMEFSEIEKIAKFLSSVDRNIQYRLYQFTPQYLDNKISRAPGEDEMLKNFEIAKKYLKNVHYFVYSKKIGFSQDYKFVEVRANEVLENFKKIDKISKKIDKNWDIKYFTFNQILSLNR
ncbi:hypothetical protein AUJ66_04045 [Candidatus Desantisbacteria bacterium CG1_02_38_46]|uniref:Radical SAM core domain-containing protein n=2 Tax=unclassified Candidatus Desantisiibacteriota TaxID=3106372 RepID=A0A2H9PCQ7_9BACT|nr:MAG: hypothetical protein AUJ66_04045 [Candidatus Desantisbacteria bacterium CG1_02_38_46]PIZ16205.1 MAG: hypothetical protein COY51_03320 [Candidatus Desantisbacteria bacterium CG_4_10_14_0_8_um_filter_39_17]